MLTLYKYQVCRSFLKPCCLSRGFDNVTSDRLAFMHLRDFPWFNSLEIHSYRNHPRLLELAIKCLVLATVACGVIQLLATFEVEFGDSVLQFWSAFLNLFFCVQCGNCHELVAVLSWRGSDVRPLRLRISSSSDCYVAIIIVNSAVIFTQSPCATDSGWKFVCE